MIVNKTSHNIAKRFQIKERGFIREGYYADLAIIDLNNGFKATKDDVLYKCGWSPFEGYDFPASVHATILNGKLVYKDSQFLNEPVLGQQLEFSR